MHAVTRPASLDGEEDVGVCCLAGLGPGRVVIPVTPTQREAEDGKNQ